MPELPEVERGRLVAASVARGRRIDQVTCAEDAIVFNGTSPAHFRHQLLGERVEDVFRLGKQLWFELESPPHPLFHFGMTGAFHTRSSKALQLKAGPKDESAVWPPRFAKIRLYFDDGGELVMTDARRFARIRLRRSPRHEPPISELGFDPLLDMISQPQFTAALATRRITLKSALLNQRFIAGLGNWMADEIAYQARVDPRTHCSDLTDAECKNIWQAIGEVVRVAVTHNAEDTLYPAEWLFHRRWNLGRGVTPVAGERVEFMTVGGRTTAWVPTRQGQQGS